MGMTKRYWEQLEEEKQAKQEALLDLPENLGETNALVEELRERIRDLKDRIESDNSWQSKLKDYLIGGFIGALLGFALSLLI